MNLKNKNGNSIIQVVIAMGITGILTMAILTLSSNQSKEMKYFKQKLEFLQMENLLSSALADPATCETILTANNISINTNDLPSNRIVIPLLKSSADPAAPALLSANQAYDVENQLTIKEIFLDSFSAGGGDRYFANFNVELDSSTLVRALRPAKVRLLFSADMGTPADSRRMTSCRYTVGPPPPPATVLPGTTCGACMTYDNGATNGGSGANVACNGVSICGGNCPAGYYYTAIFWCGAHCSGWGYYSCVKS